MESFSKQSTGPPIAKLMLAGLRANCEAYHKICYAMAEGVGSIVAEYLQLCLQLGESSHEQRQRYGEAARLAEKADSYARHIRRRAAKQRAVLEGICSPDKEVYEPAMAALPHLCAEPASAVVVEALACENQPARCEALLDALDKSGLEVGIQDQVIVIGLGVRFFKAALGRGCQTNGACSLTKPRPKECATKGGC